MGAIQVCFVWEPRQDSHSGEPFQRTSTRPVRVDQRRDPLSLDRNHGQPVASSDPGSRAIAALGLLRERKIASMNVRLTASVRATRSRSGPQSRTRAVPACADRRSSRSRQLQIKGVRLAFRQDERGPTWTPFLEQIGIAFLARFQISDGNRHILAGRQTADREPALLIGTRAFNKPGVWAPLGGIISKYDDGGIERDAIAVIRNAARDGAHPLSQLNLEFIDV